MGEFVETTKRRRWRGNKYIWMLIALVVVCVLLYYEQTALLYVISTLLLSGLLLIVAFSDLESRDRELSQRVGDGTITPEKNVTGATSGPDQSIDDKKTETAA